MKKNIVVIVLSILLLGCISFIIYDVLSNKKEEETVVTPVKKKISFLDYLLKQNIESIDLVYDSMDNTKDRTIQLNKKQLVELLNESKAREVEFNKSYQVGISCNSGSGIRIKYSINDIKYQYDDSCGISVKILNRNEDAKVNLGFIQDYDLLEILENDAKKIVVNPSCKNQSKCGVNGLEEVKFECCGVDYYHFTYNVDYFKTDLAKNLLASN